MAYTQIVYHIVLRTKRSELTIAQENVSSLYKYVWGIIKNKKGTLYRINGMEDHLHILSDLHPSIALADFVKSIKVATSLWMKQSADFPFFRGWEEGYAVFGKRMVWNRMNVILHRYSFIFNPSGCGLWMYSPTPNRCASLGVIHILLETLNKSKKVV